MDIFLSYNMWTTPKVKAPIVLTDADVKSQYKAHYDPQKRPQLQYTENTVLTAKFNVNLN